MCGFFVCTNNNYYQMKKDPQVKQWLHLMLAANKPDIDFKKIKLSNRRNPVFEI